MKRHDATALTLSPEQQKSADRFTAFTGHPLQGPFAVWIETPHIIAPALDMFAGFREPRKVPMRLFKLAILVVARHWSAQFEWHTHARLALQEGVAPEIVEAIRTHRDPPFVKDDERATYQAITELNDTKTLSDETYARAEKTLGREHLIELVAGAGYFVMIAMTLNAFQILPKGGERPLD